MKITTTRFGEVEVDDNLVFDFLEPILGYEHLKQFCLIDHSEDSPFKWLQAIEDPNIAFPITFPAYFGIQYEFVIPEDKAKSIELTSADNLLSFNIVNIPQGNVQASTVNLAGPIIINVENKRGMQLVLTNPDFAVKHKLFAAEVEPKEEKPKKKKKKKVQPKT